MTRRKLLQGPEHSGTFLSRQAASPLLATDPLTPATCGYCGAEAWAQEYPFSLELRSSGRGNYGAMRSPAEATKAHQTVRMGGTEQ